MRPSRNHPVPRLWAKIGATALQLGQLREATAAYRSLAEAAPDPGAMRPRKGWNWSSWRRNAGRDEVALTEAVAALRAVAPEYPLGRHALNVDAGSRRPGLAHRFCGGDWRWPRMPARSIPCWCVRPAPSPGPVLCGAAVPAVSSPPCGDPVGRGIPRRKRSRGLLLPDGCGATDHGAGQRRGVVSERGRPGLHDPLGRAAMMGLGDARVRQGDIIGAALAYQTVLSSGLRSDSLSVVAAAKLMAWSRPTCRTPFRRDCHDRGRSLLVCGILVLAACKSGGGNSAPNLGPVPVDPGVVEGVRVDSMWQKGLNDFRKGSTSGLGSLPASRCWSSFPATRAFPEAHFYLGESYFGSGSQLQAVREFRKVSDDFPSNPLAPMRCIGRGDAYAVLWRKPQLDPTYGRSAIATYTELLNRYPDSPARQGAGHAGGPRGQVRVQGMGNRAVLPAQEGVRLRHPVHEGARGDLSEHAVGATGPR